LITYEKVKSDPILFLSMTSLNVEEFNHLCVFFEKAWFNYFGCKKEPNPTRPGRPPVLKTVEDNLLFILFYLKLYPLQIIQGFLFGLGQSRTNDLIYELVEVLTIALEDMEYMPERNPEKFPHHIEGEEQALSIDGTEHRIERPSDYALQKFVYSGKKKAHSRKEIIIAGNNDRRIKYLSNIYEGKKHDKKIADDEDIVFPEGTVLYQDTGFQGYNPENVTIVQPKKKPKGGNLTEVEKENNRLISSIRVVVENVISGVKRLHIVKDIFRNKMENSSETFIAVACALYNLRTDFRLQAY